MIEETFTKMMKETFIKMLMATKIKGMNKLIEAIEKGGFFTAPCSHKYHLAKEGGLLEHSLNVFQTLVDLDATLGTDLDYTDMVVCALIHDIGKIGEFGKPFYIKENNVAAYNYNPDLIYEPHEIRSVTIASKYIDLTEEQKHAILHHNGLYGTLDNVKNSTYDKHKLSYLLHVADMYCSRFIEEE